MIDGLKISAPTFVQRPKRVFVGLDAPMRFADIPTIPDQWRRFNNAGVAVENTVGHGSYGISHGFSADGTWRYACVNEVKAVGVIPEGFAQVSVPAASFAVFKSTENTSRIGEVIEVVTRWIATSDHEPASGPMVEFYGSAYDPETGEGGFEIWSPVASVN